MYYVLNYLLYIFNDIALLLLFTGEIFQDVSYIFIVAVIVLPFSVHGRLPTARLPRQAAIGSAVDGGIT